MSSEDVENVSFSSFRLKKELLEGLHNEAFKYATPVQLQTLPMGLFAKDLIIQSKAGTGKTLVFAIIALENVRTEVKTPQVLVLSPTREVAVQNSNVIKSIGSKLGVACRPFIGGLSVSDDRENAEKCQIVVGTPGRILYLVKAGYINMQYIRLFVLDEADEFLKGNFKDVVDVIFKQLPIEKQVIATSATFPDDLRSFMHTYFRNPRFIRQKVINQCLLGIVHYNYLVKCSSVNHLGYKNKLNALNHILNRVQFTQCLIFCNQTARVETLCEDIKSWGFSTASISSAKEQLIRMKVLEKLQKFKRKILVSSDLSSRGINANYVDLIINFDVPHEYTVYMNRVNRTGRFGNQGVAITMILTYRQAHSFSTFQKAAKFTSYSLTEPVPKDLLYKIPTATAPAKSAYSVLEAHNTIIRWKKLDADIGTSAESTEVPKDTNLPTQEFVFEREDNVNEISFDNTTNEKVVSIVNLEMPSKLEISPKEIIEIKVSQESFNQANKDNQNVINDTTKIQAPLSVDVSSELRPGTNSDCPTQQNNTSSAIVDASCDNTNVSGADEKSKPIADKNVHFTSFEYCERNPLESYRKLRIADIENDKKRRKFLRKEKNSVKLLPDDE